MIKNSLYTPPCKKLIGQTMPSPINNICPLNTLFVKYDKDSLIVNVFRFYKGFVETKKLDSYAFVTFETTEDAKFALTDFYSNFKEAYPDIYVTYADAPTFSTKNKKYVYKKYTSNISATSSQISSQTKIYS